MPAIRKLGIGVAVTVIGIGGIYIAQQQFDASPARSTPKATSSVPDKPPVGQVPGPSSSSRFGTSQRAAVGIESINPFFFGVDISGVVVDTNGVPQEGVQVFATSNGFNEEGTGSTTDESGAFSLRWLGEGKFSLWLKMSWESRAKQAAIPAIELGKNQKVEGLRIVSGESRLTISGKVTDKQGNPMKSAMVRTLGRQFFRFENTNDFGEYRITGLTPGAYSLAAR